MRCTNACTSGFCVSGLPLIQQPAKVAQAGHSGLQKGPYADVGPR
jgi:hypothetical protein